MTGSRKIAVSGTVKFGLFTAGVCFVFVSIQMTVNDGDERVHYFWTEGDFWADTRSNFKPSVYRGYIFKSNVALYQ